MRILKNYININKTVLRGSKKKKKLTVASSKSTSTIQSGDNVSLSYRITFKESS